MRGKVLSVKTLKYHSLKHHGVVMFNMLPLELRKFDEKLDQFKLKLENLLEHYPD